MRDARELDPFAPDAAAQRAILLFAIVSGVLLLIAHEALDTKAQWFEARGLRTWWFTLAIAPPLMAALTVQRLADRRFIGALLGYTALLVYLAWYAGRAMQPVEVDAGAVFFPFAWALLASGHVLAAWLSVWLRRTDFAYPRLFDAAWRHVSTLTQVLAYTGAFWLLLFLWGALFKALGIVFFEDLFETARFAYPVTSLVAGYGLVLARTKSSIGDAVHLRILALWRGLLPLAAVLALAFTAALLVQGVQPLWNTRHATQLLLSLIVALVALSNAAYGKGGEAPLHPLLKRIVQAALLLLPLFAGLAAWALSLRWQQYGLSLDRLWAALSVTVASLYAVGYALAAARRELPWLSGIALVNRIASVFMASALLLTQTGVLDFRAITAHALRDRSDTLKADDLRYLRWELGSPGVTALAALQAQRASKQPESAAAIGQLLAQKRRYESQDEMAPPPNEPIQYQQPAGANASSAPLLAVLAANWAQPFGARDALDAQTTNAHWLFELELDGLPPTEWLRVVVPEASNDGRDATVFDVFQLQNDQWRLVRRDHQWLDELQLTALRKALLAGEVVTIAPLYKDVVIGARRIRFGDSAPR